MIMGKIKKGKRKPTPLFEKSIGIIGLGCIGSSLARAFVASGLEYNIIGVDTNEDTLKFAFDNGIITVGHKDIGIVKGCEIIFVCTPVNLVSQTIDRLYALVGDSALITDVASVKGVIDDKLPNGIRFVGGHPMAGSEEGGIRAGYAHMFQNAYYIICPSKHTQEQDCEFLIDLVQSIGALPLIMPSHHHDKVVSKISHMPHMVAYTMVNNALISEETKLVAASGFRDITRIASSGVDMWLNIIKYNRNNILRDIDEMSLALTDLKQDIESQDLESIKAKFTSAKALRDAIDTRAGTRYFNIKVDVIDKPGSIAKVTNLLYKNDINIKNINIENSREGGHGAMRLSFSNRADFERAQEVLARKKYKFST